MTFLCPTEGEEVKPLRSEVTGQGLLAAQSLWQHHGLTESQPWPPEALCNTQNGKHCWEGMKVLRSQKNPFCERKWALTHCNQSACYQLTILLQFHIHWQLPSFVLYLVESLFGGRRFISIILNVYLGRDSRETAWTAACFYKLSKYINNN